MASVNGIQFHYVIGGNGDPLVLLHGWPETWYEWHEMKVEDLAIKRVWGFKPHLISRLSNTQVQNK